MRTEPWYVRGICPFSYLFNSVTGPRTQPPSLEGIAFGYWVEFLLTVCTEQLKVHRQAFIYSEERLCSIPLLPEVARLFAGQVASTLVDSYVFFGVRLTDS